MNNIRVTIVIILLIGGGLLSCQKTDNQDAKNLLIEARSYYNSSDYNKALDMIDSIGASYPKAYRQIKSGELLADSVKKRINQLKIDSLNGSINNYKRQIYLERADSDNKDIQSLLSYKIDSTEALKNQYQVVIAEIEKRETERLGCTQCRTIMQQR